MVSGTEISIISQEIFDYYPLTRIQNLIVSLNTACQRQEIFDYYPLTRIQNLIVSLNTACQQQEIFDYYPLTRIQNLIVSLNTACKRLAKRVHNARQARQYYKKTRLNAPLSLDVGYADTYPSPSDENSGARPRVVPKYDKCHRLRQCP